MKKEIISLAALLAICSVCYATITPQDMNDLTTDLNKGLPKKIDAVTQLVSTSTDGATLYYHYVIDRNAEWVDESKFNKEKDKITHLVCSDELSKKLFANGMNIQFNYVDKHGVTITNILFTPKDCAQ